MGKSVISPKISELLEQSNFNHIELHVEEVNKKDLAKKVGLYTYQLPELKECSKKRIFKTSKNMKNNDFENMVVRMKLTNNDIKDRLNKKHIGAEHKLFFDSDNG